MTDDAHQQRQNLLAQFNAAAYTGAATSTSAPVDLATLTDDGGDGLILTPASDVAMYNVTWTWRERVPSAALSLLVGFPGLGKSTVAAWLAARASRGDLDGDLESPADVVYCSAEDSPSHTLKPRLTAAGADLDRIHIATMRREGLDGDLALPDDVEALGRAIETVSARLVIVDPVMAHLGGTIDSHRDASLRAALAPLFHLADHHDCAVICIGHLNKSQSGDLFSRIGGSIGLTGAARSVLLAAHDPEAENQDDSYVLIHGKSNLGPLQPTLRYQIGTEYVTGEAALIHTSAVLWAGEADGVKSGDVLGNEDRESRNATDEAVDFLRLSLADGPRPGSEVKAEARKVGIADRTLQRARTRAGVQWSKDGFGGAVYWHLPDANSDE